MESVLVDANVLLRFLVGDDPAQSRAATNLIRRAESGEFQLRIEHFIVAETVYVLSRVFKKSRSDIATALTQLLQSKAFTCSDMPLLLDALVRYRDYKVDFADAYLAAIAKVTSTAVASFDADFDGFPDIKLFAMR